MATQAFLGRGAAVYVGDAGGPTSFVKVAETRSFTGPNQEGGEVEVTSLESTVEEFIAGFPVVDNIPVVSNWDPVHATQDHNTGVIALFDSGESRYWKLEWIKGGSVIRDMTFTGFVRKWNLSETTPKAEMRLEWEIRRTSQPTWGP